jgi:hypothetical protein
MIDLKRFKNDPNFKRRKIINFCGGINCGPTCVCCNRDTDPEDNDSQMDIKFDYNYLSSWEIMTVVYGPLPFIVRISAQMNVSHHLSKLKKEGKIEFCYPDLWRINKSF